MTYRAQWTLADGTPAPGPDLGTVQPGQTRSVTRLLKNIGDQPLSAVQVALLVVLTAISTARALGAGANAWLLLPARARWPPLIASYAAPVAP